ncbi:MAG: 50S ribosomal protein L24 [Legionellaceae bacterium]
MTKLKKDDYVIVIAGKDKGKKGKILRVLPKLRKVLVEGINLVKKAVKPNPQLNQEGGIKVKEALLDISNVALVHPATGKPSKVRFEIIDNNKVRLFKTDGQLVDS